MSFELKQAEPVSRAVTRILHERLDAVVRSLGKPGRKNVDAVVHDARKRCKEARAALKLVRRELGDPLYRRANASLRDAARPLSAVRDAYVLVEALDGLLERYPDEVPPAAARVIRAALVKRGEAVRRRILGADGRTLPKTAAAIAAARRRLGTFSFDHDGWRAIEPNLRRTYRDGRRAMRRAFDGGGDDEYHEWRKRGKDLRYQLEMLCPLDPEKLASLADAAHKLADVLGEDHDLAVLREVLEQRALFKDAAPVVDLISRRRKRLRRKAAKLGDDLYTDKPDAFTDRLHELWKRWKN